MRTILIILLVALPASAQFEVPIRDLVRVDNGPANHIFGYGLVIGLQGTGDSRQALFSSQSVGSMLRRLGIEIGDASLQARNVAAVMCTATLDPFTRAGDSLDVTVAAIGDARSLQGGILLQTPLQDAGGAVRGMAQGAVSIGGFIVTGGGGNGAQKNHPTVGRVPSGMVLTSNTEGVVAPGGIVSLRLMNPDYTTATRIADAVRAAFRGVPVQAMDPGRVTIRVPDEYLGREPLFVSQIETLRVQPESRARVVINERTGTVVVGGAVRLLPVAVTHGALKIDVQAIPLVSQPAPFTRTDGARTVVVPDIILDVEEEPVPLAVLDAGQSINDLVRVLNALEVTPRDLIAIFQALAQQGALLAELEIM